MFAKCTPVTITHEFGARFSATIRSHEVRMDQPVGNGGDDSAPTPVDLVVGALGGCVALYTRRFLLNHELSPAGLEVDVEQRAMPRDGRRGAFAITVRVPVALTVRQRELLERVIRACPVHTMLECASTISLEIESLEITPAFALA